MERYVEIVESWVMSAFVQKGAKRQKIFWPKWLIPNDGQFALLIGKKAKVFVLQIWRLLLFDVNVHAAMHFWIIYHKYA